jgi:hypothetical protein
MSTLVEKNILFPSIYIAMSKQNKVWKHPKKIVVLKIINKKGPKESSRGVCSANLEDSLGKEQLYRRKIKKNHVWEIEIIIVAIMKVCLFSCIGAWRQTICKYTFFMKKTRSEINIQMLEHVETKT